MRASFVASFAVIAAAVACSSAPPEPPGTLAAPARNARASDDGDDPPPVSTTKGADAGSGEACATVPPTNKCGLAPQCGCAVNETCDITTEETGATSCVTGGAATMGRPCKSTGECTAGLTCSYGACRPYCGAPRTKCDAPGTELCIEVPGPDGKPLPNFNVCTVACDPFDPKGVCGTNSCHWFESRYAPFKVSDCNYPGPGKLKDACEFDDDCAPGLLCLGKKCEKWCRIGEPGDCQPNHKCEDYFGADAPVVGGVTRGVCLD